MTSVAMLFCFPRTISLKFAAELWPKTIFDMAAVRQVEFKNFHIWSCDCHSSDVLLCTKFHQNWVIFRWDIAIWRFSRWRITIVNFIGPRIGSFKSPCGTSYWQSIETIHVALNCLIFGKIIFVQTFWRQMDRQTNRRSASCIKPHSRSRVAA